MGFVAMKAATVAVLPTEHPMDDHDDFEPHHESSPTDHVLNELQLHGYRPFADEPDSGFFRTETQSRAPSPTSSTR